MVTVNSDFAWELESLREGTRNRRGVKGLVFDRHVAITLLARRQDLLGGPSGESRRLRHRRRLSLRARSVPVSSCGPYVSVQQKKKSLRPT